jgi:hypothetical protein
VLIDSILASLCKLLSRDVLGVLKASFGGETGFCSSRFILGWVADFFSLEVTGLLSKSSSTISN